MIHRCFNIVFAISGLILISPVLLLLAVLVKWHDGGPVFYRARRVGKGGREFDLLKFRSMIVNADRAGIGLTAKDDHRITPVGRFLRKTKCDELPQLWNVMRGEMNLVGPRPEDPRFVKLYDSGQREILSFRPGMTSPASIAFRREEELHAGSSTHQRYVEELLPKKLELDLAYCRQQNAWTDIKTIIRTLTLLHRS